MTVSECRRRVDHASFGVLGTVDPDLGIHLVPVVFAIQSDDVVIPVDAVKPKSSTQLRRVANLRANRLASLLVDHRDADWDALWWVRLDLEFAGSAEPVSMWQSALASRYPQYEPANTIDSLLLFTVRSMRGWTAT